MTSRPQEGRRLCVSDSGAGQRQLCERRHAVDLDSLLRLTPRPQPATIKTVNIIAQRQFATDHSESNMKSYQISEDRLIVVKKNLVTIKQKDSDKSFEFTPSRLVLHMFVTIGLVCVNLQRFIFHFFCLFRSLFVC